MTSIEEVGSSSRGGSVGLHALYSNEMIYMKNMNIETIGEKLHSEYVQPSTGKSYNSHLTPSAKTTAATLQLKWESKFALVHNFKLLILINY